jgi:hypothetical protein
MGPRVCHVYKHGSVISHAILPLFLNNMSPENSRIIIYFFPSKLHALLSVTLYIYDIFARIFNGLLLLCTAVLNITSQGWHGGTPRLWEETGGKKRAGGKGRKEKGGRKRAGRKGWEEKGGKTRHSAYKRSIDMPWQAAEQANLEGRESFIPMDGG